jgi:hypothetical protein
VEKEIRMALFEIKKETSKSTILEIGGRDETISRFFAYNDKLVDGNQGCG